MAYDVDTGRQGGEVERVAALGELSSPYSSAGDVAYGDVLSLLQLHEQLFACGKYAVGIALYSVRCGSAIGLQAIDADVCSRIHAIFAYVGRLHGDGDDFYFAELREVAPCPLREGEVVFAVENAVAVDVDSLTRCKVAVDRVGLYAAAVAMEGNFAVAAFLQGRCGTFAYGAVVISPRVVADVAAFGSERAVVAASDEAAAVLVGRVGAVIVDEVRFAGDAVAVFIGSALCHAAPLVGRPLGGVVGVVATAAYDETLVVFYAFIGNIVREYESL